MHTARATTAAFVGALAALAATACGNNAPDIPPELLQGSGGQTAAYPPEPYGNGEGDVVKPVCFAKGWRDPTAAGYDTSRMEQICFSDFYDPDGKKGVKLLMLNTAAFWCSACKEEHPELPGVYAELHPKGLEILSAVYEKSDRSPTGPDDLALWAKTFGTNFPMVTDPTFKMGFFIDAATAPINVIVNARTMAIEKRYVGDQRAAIQAYLHSQLDTP